MKIISRRKKENSESKSQTKIKRRTKKRLKVKAVTLLKEKSLYSINAEDSRKILKILNKKAKQNWTK
jgi:hypothetical protein